MMLGDKLGGILPDACLHGGVLGRRRGLLGFLAVHLLLNGKTLFRSFLP
jgi:hypothetical protein